MAKLYLTKGGRFMRRFGFLVFAAMLMGFLVVGAPPSMAKDMTADDFVAEAKKDVCEVSVSEAKEMLDKGGWVFLDCREPKEYKMGHVPGAINIPRGVIEFSADKKIPDKNAKILVYCKIGGRGCLTACTLCRMGYKNVRNLGGGWAAWEKAGYPVE
jgi:rhodanese-related sulfurtransferase